MSLIVPSTTNASLSGYFEPTICKRVEYGIGSLSKLPEILGQLGITKAFVVTGRSLATKSDAIDKVKNAVAKGGTSQVVGVFHDIGQHAPIQSIRDGTSILKNADADGIIAVGGGSPIDAAKVIVAEHLKGTGKLLPMISVPTTLSAAETSIGAGYTDDNGRKTGVAGKDFTSSALLYDGELAMTTPLHIWLYTGIRAVDHAVESQITMNKAITVPIRALCRDAIGTLFESLRAAKLNPTDVEARQRSLIGAWLSLWTDNRRVSSLGLSHTLGYFLGAPYGIPHGLCSVLTLPPTIRVYAKHFKGADLESLAQILSFADEETAVRLIASGAEAKEKVLALADAVQRLCEDLGLTPTLTEYKVPEGDLPMIAKGALAAFKGEYDYMYDDVLAALKGMY